MKTSGRTQEYLRAASGYLELGMLGEAAAELEKIGSDEKSLSDVLSFKFRLYFAAGQWDMAAETARELVNLDPHDPQWWINRASAVRLSDSIHKAEAILLKAMEVHPTEAMIRFNLACFASATGRILEAKSHLREAIELNEGVRQFILEDPDLTPVWDSICKDLPKQDDDL